MSGWSGENHGRDGIWINRDENTPERMKRGGFTSTLIHESAHYWVGDIIYEESWLKEGYAELFTLLTLEKMGRKEDAEREKDDWHYRVKKYQFYDFPLDEWVTDVTEPPLKGETILAYGKSALFCYSIYETYGISPLQEINAHLYDGNVRSDSVRYLELLEKVTGEDQKERFIGWIFPPDVDAHQWQEAERKLDELEALRDITESTLRETYGVQVIVDVGSSEVKRLIKSFQFDEAIKTANAEIKRLNAASNQFGTHITAYSKAKEYYKSKNFIFEQNIPQRELLSAWHSLLTLQYEAFERQLEEFYREMEELEKYSAELESRYTELKGVDGLILDEVEAFISQGKYEEALTEMEEALYLLKECADVREEVGEVDLFTGVGMVLLDRGRGEYEEDVEHALEEIKNANLERASQLLAQTQEKLSRARTYGMAAVLVGVVVVFSLCVVVVKRRKRY